MVKTAVSRLSICHREGGIRRAHEEIGHVEILLVGRSRHAGSDDRKEPGAAETCGEVRRIGRKDRWGGDDLGEVRSNHYEGFVEIVCNLYVVVGAVISLLHICV